MAVELKIKIKGEEKKKFEDTYLVYEKFEFHQDDPVIRKYIALASNDFAGETDTMTITSKMVVV